MTPVFVSGPVRVRTPATSANLGPGFDALGLAVTLYDEVVARVGAAGVRVVVSGEGDGDVPLDETHLVARAMLATFDRVGGRPDGFDLSCTNCVPHGRGLGSSAAAIVGGVLAARALVVDGAQLLSDEDVLALASELEGHPDNVAACLLGGLTIAWSTDRTGRAVRVAADPDIVPVAFLAPTPASTAHVRGLLPPTVRHADAAFAAGRSALLIAALTGRPEVLFAATEDTLHQQYRASAMPGTAGLLARLREAGLAAVVSGAGPSVLVLARDEVEVEKALDAAPPGWRAVRLAVATSGAEVEPAAE